MAQPPSLRAQFPSGPLIDETGEITPVWRAYFSQLYIRTGGAVGASSDTTQLQADLDAEEAARQAADLVLTTGLAAERTAREAADSAEAAARAQADARLLPLAGGTMTGNIILPAATPTLPRQAVSKSYVDGAVGGAAYAPIDSPPFTGNPTAPTPAPGDADTSIATTGFVAAAVAPALNNVGRNLIHNGLFNVAQRGVGPFTIGYTLDRWLLIVTADTVSVTQGQASDASRAQIGDEQASYFLSNTFTGNAAPGSLTILHSRIENVRRLAGKTVTVSFWGQSTAGLKLGINIMQHFGTGGAPSADVRALVTGNAATLTSTFARYSTSIAIPSLTGKTVGTNGNDFTALELWFSSGATYNAIAGNIGVQSGTINIWGVQLEIGAIATPLEKPDPQVDLANCQRFYLASQVIWLGYTGAGTQTHTQITLPVAMRAQPTVVPSFGTTTNLSGATMAADNPFTVRALASGVALGAFQLIGTYTASADL